MNQKTHSENESPDAISELQKLQATLQRERLAWAKLLENLKELRTKINRDKTDQNTNHLK